MRLAQDRKQAVALRYEEISKHLPELSGFEDGDSKNLILANRYLRQSKMATLKPLLPLMLRLKGQPYRLNNYFPFEPFFRTRMSKMTLLKTGRQVSKCFDWLAWVLMADGTRKQGKDLKVGDVVMSRDGNGRLVPCKITKVWHSGMKPVVKIITESGRTLKVSGDHRLFVRDADIHTEEYRKSVDIYRGDYLNVVNEAGRLVWERVVTCTYDGTTTKMIDIEVEEHHNFILDDVVSHNSTSLAAQGVVFSNSIPYFSTLYVTPLFEMIRRFSHQYVRQFLEESPFKRLFLGSNTINSVLQRSFKNGASMFFSYAFLDAERTRGIPADKNVIDEIQDMQHDFLQIIHETLSGSPYGLIQYAGTPKSLDNTMQTLWTDSSQAEWVMRCETCRHWNIPALDWDLLDMIGPWHSGISEACPGIVCAKCVTPTGKRRPLNPRKGRWVHKYKDRRWSFAGYHVPQIIMPMHYANHEKWETLVGKMHGRANTTFKTFLNEACGESCDEGSKLVTVTDLKQAACLPWPNDWREAVKHLKGYKRRIVCVDWGGGGGRVSTSAASKKDSGSKRLRTSYTSIAVLGYRPDGKIDVIWGHRSLKTHDMLYEARLVLDIVVKFKATHIAHDYGGAGAGREVLVVQNGFPISNIAACKYHGAASHNIMTFHEATEDHPRDWWSIDKSRSLILTCMCIKYGLLRFFQYDHKSADRPGLLHDFLALMEEKVQSRLGTDAFYIDSHPNMPDDFAQAINIGCCTLWHMEQAWPDIAEAAKYQLPASLLAHVHPTAKVDWADIDL